MEAIIFGIVAFIVGFGILMWQIEKEIKKEKVNRKFHKVVIQNSEGNLETGYVCPYLPSTRNQNQILNFKATNGTFWYINCFIYKGKNKEDSIEKLLFCRIREFSNTPLSREEVEKELNK